MLKIAPISFLVLFGPKLLSAASKLLKSAKVIKAGLATASFASFTWLFSWEFALVVLFSLVVHEFGHVWAMRSVGIPTKGFYLIPFIGGAAVPERAFASRLETQYVAMAGPVFGLAQAVALYALYLATLHPLAAALASWVALFNVINLLPIMPLDGGRILKSIAFSVHSTLGAVVLVGGIVLCVGLIVYLRSWMMAIILAAALFDFMYEKWWGNFQYLPEMTPGQTARAFFSYALITGGLVAITFACSAVPSAGLALSMLRD